MHKEAIELANAVERPEAASALDSVTHEHREQGRDEKAWVADRDVGDGHHALNAIDAMSDNAADLPRTLTLRVEHRSDTLALIVDDTGPGSSESAKISIFEAFYTIKAEGTGPGLAVATDIARAHQGQVVVEDKVGRGARFGLIIPVVSVVSVSISNDVAAQQGYRKLQATGAGRARGSLVGRGAGARVVPAAQERASGAAAGVWRGCMRVARLHACGAGFLACVAVWRGCMCVAQAF